jgi:hypothetical protein
MPHLINLSSTKRHWIDTESSTAHIDTNKNSIESI